MILREHAYQIRNLYTPTIYQGYAGKFTIAIILTEQHVNVIGVCFPMDQIK
jgi:hypothetical protein